MNFTEVLLILMRGGIDEELAERGTTAVGS